MHGGRSLILDGRLYSSCVDSAMEAKGEGKRRIQTVLKSDDGGNFQPMRGQLGKGNEAGQAC